MQLVANRHAGTLGGHLVPLSDARRVVAEVAISSEHAAVAAVQHTAWMLCNLLARQVGVVERIELDCPSQVPLAQRIVPLASRDIDFRRAVVAGVEAIGAVPIDGERAPRERRISLFVGPGAAQCSSRHVYGDGWVGTVSDSPISLRVGSSALPLGPYIAACLAAAEIFLAVRQTNGRPAAQTVSYSAWTNEASPDVPDDAGPQSLNGLELKAILAGCGAVGSTWVHALWATGGIHGQVAIADADPLGVDETNLNRCPVFGYASIGRYKATEAARICADADLTLVPHDSPVGDIADSTSLLVSAVDTNTSRRAVQGLYPPRLLAGSTHNLRAEILRCDPQAETACIHCHNAPENDLPDADARRAFRRLGRAEQEKIAATHDMTIEDAHAWAVNGTCGYATDRLLAEMRQTTSEPEEWSVGFVSVIAGTMLAAQTYKEVLGAGPLAGAVNRATLQLLDPLASSNSPKRLARDNSCPMCKPDIPAVRVWRRRYNSFNLSTLKDGPGS